MVARFGRHVVKHSSHVQSTIALSVGESEYYSVVKGAAVGFALQALLEDWHIYKMAVELESDSTSAKGTTDRMGSGKLRHVRTRYLWGSGARFQRRHGDSQVAHEQKHFAHADQGDFAPVHG